MPDRSGERRSSTGHGRRTFLLQSGVRPNTVLTQFSFRPTRAFVCAALAGFLLAQAPSPALAQGVQVQAPVRPAPLPTGPTANPRAEQANDAVIMLMAGRPGGEFLDVADDIATVASDGRTLRVLPIVGDGGAQNIRDLVLLRNVDLAITQVATLNRLAAGKDLSRTLDRQILYITPLFHDEMHVLARADVKSIADLNGRRVNLNTDGSGTDLMAPQVFEALGIKVQRVNVSQGEAIERMRRGELDATICICLRPVRPFQMVKSEWGLKLLAVPFQAQLEKDFLPGRLDAADYPALMRDGDKIDTIALQTALVTFNWPKNSVRYNKVARFVESMFGKFKEFARPGRNERWASVNLAASLPGWQRFPAAQEWLDSNAQVASSELQKEFSRFISDAPQTEKVGATGSTADSERLFREFLQWRRERRN